MSINAIINHALTGLNTNQQALRTTSNNIANVNTPGYARRVVFQENNVVGGQSFGVKVSEIRRITDQFLEAAARTAKADAGQYSAQSGIHEQIQSLLGSPDQNSSFSGRIDDIFSSLSDLTLNPSGSGRRENLLFALQQFGDEASRISDQLQKLRSDADRQITADVTKINDQLKRIDALNVQIRRTIASGDSPAALEEQRNSAINEISGLIDVSVARNADGSVRISTSSGLALLDVSASELRYSGAGAVNATTLFPTITVHATDPVTGVVAADGRALDGAIRSGELRGLLDMRDDVLPGIGASIGELSRQVIDSINAVHNASTAVPAPNALVGRDSGLLGSDLQGFSGKATFAVVDSAGVAVNSVTIDFDALASGTTLDDVVSAVNSGLGGDGTLAFSNGVMSLTATSSTNGVVIAQDDSAPSSRGGRGFSDFFGMNDLLQSQVPTNFDTGFTAGDAHGFTAGGTMDLEVRGPNGAIAGSYTLTVSGTSFNDLLSSLNATSALGNYVTFSLDSAGALVSTPKAGYENFDVVVRNDNTVRGASGESFSRLFGLGPHYQMQAARAVKVTPAIASDNTRLALARYDASAASGEPVITAGDGRGALAMQQIQDSAVSFSTAGRLQATSATLGQYGADVLANTGVLAAQAANLAQDYGALSTEVDSRLSNVTGVNLDEELANMVVFQNAFNASARLITTSQEMMDTLLGILR